MFRMNSASSASYSQARFDPTFETLPMTTQEYSSSTMTTDSTSTITQLDAETRSDQNPTECPHQRTMIAEINIAYNLTLHILDWLESYTSVSQDIGTQVSSWVILVGKERDSYWSRRCRFKLFSLLPTDIVREKSYSKTGSHSSPVWLRSW